MEKSFMVAKAYRDLEEFAKSFDLAPTHVGSISAGQRYCDNGSCATCIKQKSRDDNDKQTALHIRKDDDVEKGLPSVARQAIREGKGANAFRQNGPMQFRMGANNAGKRASAGLSAGGERSHLNTIIDSGRNTKDHYRLLSGEKNVANRGKIGLQRSTINPGTTVRESQASLSEKREALLRSRRPVQIRGGEANKPAW